MKTRDIVIPAVCAAVGIGIGFAGGFIFAKNKYKKKYEQEAETQMFEFLKNNKVPDGEKVTPEKAEEIGKDFPKELWTEQFKKDQEKRKEAREIVREEKYYIDDDGNEVSKKEIYDPAEYEHPEEDEERYNRCKEEFNDKLDLYSEFSGISRSELLQGTVNIIDAEDYYESEHDSDDLEEFQWNADTNELRDVDGNVVAPEITFGPEYADILQYCESMPASTIYLHDERLDAYYTVCLENPMDIK